MKTKGELTQAKITNGFLVAQSFQMAKMNRGLEKVSKSIEQNSIIQAALYEIQNDIKKIQSEQLDEVVKANKLKEYEIEQNRLRYEQEKAEKEDIRIQKNLAFELKNSVEEVEKSDGTLLEKYFFLKTSYELFLELDTEKFDISEMEYSRNALNSIVESKKKYQAQLTKKDKDDLKMVESIEEDDENKHLINLLKDLEKLSILKKLIESINEINVRLSPTKIETKLGILISDIKKKI